jgi:MFS family permease
VHNGEHPPLPRRPARRLAAHGQPSHPLAARGQPSHPLAARGQPAHAAPSGRHRLPGAPPVPARDVFANTEFRALWCAQLLSSAGDQLAQVAIGFVVYAKTGSPFLTALAYALTYLPAVLGGPALAGLADAFPRQQMMIILDLARAGLVALIALPGMPIPGLAALFFGTMLLGTPFAAARAGLLTELLPRTMRPAGQAIGQQTAQLGQIAGLLAAGGLVAALGPYRALALDSLSFSLSAGILACWVPSRAAPASSRRHRDPVSLPAREITWAGVATIFGTPALRTMVLFGWLAGFAVVPEGLAAPYARTLGGGAATIGLLLAAAPAGLLIGTFVLGRLIRPSERLRPIGWLAMLSCAPLIFCQVHPPVALVAALWAVSGAGGAYQLAAAAAFIRALPATDKAPAFAVAQSGLLTAQALGLLIAGATATRFGPQAAVALAGLLGLVAAAVLATDWIRRHGELLARLDGPQPQRTAPPQQPGGRADLPDGSLGASAQVLGRRHVHRAPRDGRDLPGEARLAAARLLDQILGDRRALSLFRDDDPPGQVDQRAHAERDHRDSHEDEPDQGGVDAEVLSNPGADTGHQPAVPRPD